MTVTVDRLLRSRRKTISIIIEPDGALLVRAPLRMAQGRIDEFVRAHAGWVLKHQAKARARQPFLQQRYEDGQEFPLFGRQYPLKVAEAGHVRLKFDGKCFTLSKASLPQARELFIAWYKAQAKRALGELLPRRAAELGFHYKKMRVTSARTRWGSCSTSGTLSFTYRLVMAPPEVIDYVIVHELVHTKVQNHSRQFWSEVERILPDFKEKRDWLKKNGGRLA